MGEAVYFLCRRALAQCSRKLQQFVPTRNPSLNLEDEFVARRQGPWTSDSTSRERSCVFAVFDDAAPVSSLQIYASSHALNLARLLDTGLGGPAGNLCSPSITIPKASNAVPNCLSLRQDPVSVGASGNAGVSLFGRCRCDSCSRRLVAGVQRRGCR